jgi:hypothetical protein
VNDDAENGARDAAPVTSMSLRAERLRRRMAKAAGAKVGADPGLSAAPAPRDPAETNRFAIVALAAGIVAVFVSGFYVASIVSLAFAVPAWRRARALHEQGLRPWGRRRTMWAFWLAVFGIAQYTYALVVIPLFR